MKYEREVPSLSSSQLVMLLTDLAVITVTARLFGWIATLLRQPSVVGEVAAGIFCGPIVIGAHASTLLFPHDVRQYLMAFANVGVAVFMFQIGMEVDGRIFAHRRRMILAVSIGAYLLPFALGALLAATVLFGHHGEHPVGFVFFIGAALAVTAFPVLARILSDRDMIRSWVGQFSLAAAAINDLLAWSALALLAGLSNSHSASQARLLLLVPALGVIWSARKMLNILERRKAPSVFVPIAVIGALLCGAGTEWIGLHLIFGAFLFGAAFPRTHREFLMERLNVVSLLFLPAFFVVAGLAVDINALSRTDLLDLVLVVTAAVFGKIGGTYASARVSGIRRRDAGILASLMNTRGLTELIILVVGLSLGLIDTRIYSLLVIAALFTTAMTGPLLTMITRRHDPDDNPHTLEPDLSNSESRTAEESRRAAEVDIAN
ncbi:cation/H(+) antiporter [Nocardia sp. ET3-3]|uniref:Cation/H(+) antiporter n=1 Tax=Nocardia terrae TaxID=2675851 RepID=A0A7K1V5H1_9NOCA|nr:cation:proton antiporter [Nocardia terrae]MVU81338.1 cation/H(+) antiporter [Nocardia terrae]